MAIEQTVESAFPATAGLEIARLQRLGWRIVAISDTPKSTFGGARTRIVAERDIPDQPHIEFLKGYEQAIKFLEEKASEGLPECARAAQYLRYRRGDSNGNQ